MLNISIKSNYSEVRGLTHEFHSFCNKNKLNKELSDQLELILVESINNIIEHAYKEEKGLPIKVRIKVSLNQVSMIICDQGRAIPNTLKSRDNIMPDIADLPEGGWGVALIYHLSDKVKYSTKNGINFLVIHKNRD